ncbi:MAG: radical SAM protein [Chloroflexota bacterium]|jgi:uncharacterized protein
MAMHRCKFLVLHRLVAGGWIAINGLSGAVDLLDDSTKETFDRLASGSNGSCDPELLKTMRRRGYLFETREEEERLLLSQWERFQKRIQERPFSFALCPTYNCNLACRYCFEGNVTSGSTYVLGADAISAAFDAIDKVSAQQPSRKPEVSLFGGEPLLPITMEAVSQTLREAESRGMGVGVVTNGVHVATTFRDLITEYRHIFSHCQITVDGPQPIHDARRIFRSGKGSYEATMQGVDLLVKLGLRVNLRVNIDSHNVRHLPELADIIINNGWAEHKNLRCSLAPVADHPGTSKYPYKLTEEQLVREVAEVMESSENVRKLFRMDLFRSVQHLSSVLGLTSTKGQPLFQYCESNGLNTYVFGADGYIYPCSEMLDQPDLAIGTFYPSFEIDEAKAAPWRNRNILTMPKCRDCEVATFCGGGCAYQALKQNGSPMEPACYGAEKVIEAFLDCFSHRLIPR